MVPSRAAHSALSQTRACCTATLTPASSVKPTAESLSCSSWMRILRDTGSLGWGLRLGHGQAKDRDRDGDRDRNGDGDPVDRSYRDTL